MENSMMPSQQRLKLDLQEKNAFYFRVLEIIRNEPDPKEAAKLILATVNEVWNEKIIETFEPDQALNPKRKPSFKRVET